MSFMRTASHGGRVALWHGGRYHVLEAAVSHIITQRGAVDDAIFDGLVAKLEDIAMERA